MRPVACLLALSCLALVHITEGIAGNYTDYVDNRPLVL